MKEVFIISTGDIVHSKTAGAQRVMNIAKALAAGNVRVNLCSLALMRNRNIEYCELASGIFYFQSQGDKSSSFPTTILLRSMNRFMKRLDSDKVIYLYPTVFVIKDIIYFIYFKVFKRYRFYCDINELRVTNTAPLISSENIVSRIVAWLKSVYNYTIFRLSELPVAFYDGIVVISTNLEKYFSRYTKKVLRIPILCDISKISDERQIPTYNGGAFRICFAGSVNCRKEGFNIFFEALRKVNAKRVVELYLYGILLEKDRIELFRLIQKHHLERNVFYVGNFEPDELLKIFPQYNLLVIPRPLNSQAKYGFSTKLSEYLISGVPVLVTDVSDNSKYIKDNFNGYIIPPGSSTLMTEKLIEIIENYNYSAKIVVENALFTARKYFDYKLYTDDLVNFLFRN